jgi:hypothetical protein
MTVPLKKNLVIQQGKTFELPVRWEVVPIIYKQITGITRSAPAVVSCPGHGIPDGWRVAVTSVVGMTKINASNTPPKDSDYVIATLSDEDSVELNTVNSSLFKEYVSGGYLQYYTPQDLASFSARMSIKNKVGGTELLSLTTENGRIVIDNTQKTITLLLEADDTELLSWKSGVYDLELVSLGGVVTALLYGSVTVTPEVTT